MSEVNLAVPVGNPNKINGFAHHHYGTTVKKRCLIMKNKQIYDPRNITKTLLWLILAVAVLLVVIVRIRLLDFPLERDEGEYAYAGQLMLQGTPPYQLAYNMKMPGVYVAYALIMAIFGQTTAGIHLGLIMVNIATAVLVFFLAKRVGDFAGAVIASSVYILLSVSPAMLGMAGHATHFVLLPAVAGLLALLRALERNEKTTLFLSGFLFGLAFLMKQHGVFFGLFGGLYLIGFDWKTLPASWKRVAVRGALYSAGAILPFGLLCLWLVCAGVFDTFWFWTVSYGRQYVSQVPLAVAAKLFPASFAGVLQSGPLLWLLAGAGIILLTLRWKAYRYRFFLTGLLLFSFLAICPGFYFREHYFILLLPVISLWVGLAVSWALSIEGRKGIVTLLLFTFACGQAVYSQRDFMFHLSPDEACRAVYGANPFPEAVKIAEYIKQHASKDATIAVLGSEPEIFFYSKLKSSTGHIYTYGLMEPQPYALTMQQQMIREIEAAKPEYIVFVNISTSWLVRPQSNKLIFDWFTRYTKENLEPVGLVDILSETETKYYWDLQKQSRSPQSPYFITVFKCRTASKILGSGKNAEP